MRHWLTMLSVVAFLLLAFVVTFRQTLFGGRRPAVSSRARAIGPDEQPDPDPAVPGQAQARGGKRGRKFALLVGVTKYNHNDLPDLAYPERDADLLGKALDGFDRVVVEHQPGDDFDRIAERRRDRRGVQRSRFRVGLVHRRGQNPPVITEP